MNADNPAEASKRGTPQSSPDLEVTRFAQLKAGSLFFYEPSHGGSVGIVVADPLRREDGNFVLPLGPHLPDRMRWPVLQEPRGLTVISFGSKFAFRLPVEPSSWTTSEPAPAVQTLVLAGSDIFLRASYSYDPEIFLACYVNAATGAICAAHGNYARPSGITAYALSWQLITLEPKPRVILSVTSPQHV